MITPRRTRLVRVPDLHAFRRAIWCLARDTPCGTSSNPPVIVVPRQAAGRQLLRSFQLFSARQPMLPFDLSVMATREGLYHSLHERLPQRPRRLTAFDRAAMVHGAAHDALAALASCDRPFALRPGLLAEVLRFYDHLRRQAQQGNRFEELIERALGGEAADEDRGTARLLQQTRFLAEAFRLYEHRVAESDACDEHTLRERLITSPGDPALGHVIVTVSDWIADPDGLFVADFDLLSRVPLLQAVDIVCTEAVLASGFHERLREWLPGLEEIDGRQIAGDVPTERPVLLAPDAPSDQLWFVERDRQEEVAAVCRRAQSRGAETAGGADTAVVYKRPLPYLYIAPETFRSARVAYQTADRLPLAAEPTAASLDLVFDLVETSFARSAITAILRSPHFAFGHDTDTHFRGCVSALDRTMSAARYLGGLDALEALVVPGPNPALDAALAMAKELEPLTSEAPASVQLRRVRAFVAAHARPPADADPLAARERRARAALLDILERTAAAHEAHHDPDWSIIELAPAVRGWIAEETFPMDGSAAGVHLVDDQAARYGVFDHVTVVGLIERDWPEAPRRNIFYPPALLKALGWPSEKDRNAAADARFLDLLASASKTAALSTITLDDDALVTRSLQLDEVARAQLHVVRTTPARDDSFPGSTASPFLDDALATGEPPLDALDPEAREWAALRMRRPPGEAPDFHGTVGPMASRSWSVSALETYLACPFKFFAQHVLALREEPDDEEVMDPRRQGEFVHSVFEAFFRTWQERGHSAITPANLDAARAVFAEVVEERLQDLPAAEAGIERTRLLGSPAAAGLGEAVLRMEAERPVAVVDRLLEQRLQGEFTFQTAAGLRSIALRGKADRLDLLADGSFRLIDYKLGWPPNRSRALQLPIYALCGEQQLAGHRGRDWTAGEAAYVAFKGPRRVVPLFSSPAERAKVLADAQQRLADTVDAIERGDFPPTPDDVYRCESCSFAAVCRKDYVGDI